MENIISSPLQLPRKISRVKIIIGAVVLVVVGIGGYSLWPKTPVYQFVTVERGSIVETVSVTGNTTPVSSVSLGFSNSGNIARVNFSVGKNVSKGQVLAELNTNDLQAQIKQAQANLALQLTQGQNTTLNVEQVKKQQNTLVENAYSALLNSSPAAEVVGDYSGYDAPTVTGTYICTKEVSYNLKTYSSSGGMSIRYSSSEEGAFLLEDAFLLTDIPRPMGKCGLFLSFDKTKLLQSGIEFNITIPNTSAGNYNINKNAYLAAQANRDKAIADAQATIYQDSDGVTVSQAQIENARAGIQSVESKLQNSQIVAPISGVITQFDAKVGQYASPGTTLISIISQGAFEVDALVSETDVGKVALSNKVTMTLDAFPSETFTGSVFYIDPAQTTSEGVVGYKIKIAFDKADPRIKSGLTANIDIKTRYKDNIYLLPQYAILQNNDGTFVQVVENNVVKDIPVTLGLQDRDGNVEIISGVSEGQQVLNVGLKQK